MRKARAVATALAIGAGAAGLFPTPVAGVQQERQSVTIAVVSDGPFARYPGLSAQLRSEIVELVDGDFEVSFAREFVGDWTATGIETALDRALVDDGVDLVIASGVIGANLLARRLAVPRPAIAAFILGPLVEPTLEASESSGVANLNYVFAERIDRSLELLRELSELGRLALLVPSALIDVVPDLEARVAEFGGPGAAMPDIVPVSAGATAALSAIDDDVGTVLILPLAELTPAGWQTLLSGLVERSLPSFSWLGAVEVRDGVLAGLTPDGFQQQLLRWTALNTQQILLGAEAADLPVSFPPQEQLVINMATAEAIGVSPRWSVLLEAELIGVDAVVPFRRLSLDRVMSEAQTVNLELAARDRFVAAGEDAVQLATAPLLPQIDLSADLQAIDKDLAAFIPGLAQRQFSGRVSLRQLLFDDNALAALSVEKSVQEFRVLDREKLRLDIVGAAGVAYLNVLRAKTFERIERDNLRVTATNLDFARLRVAAGAASPAEIFRWEAQVANNRQRVVDSEIAKEVSEFEVNRILNRPFEERFDTEEATLDAPTLKELLDQIEPYIDNPRDFDTYRRFMTAEAFDVSPELRQLDALTAAQRRVLRSASRSFYLPSVTLQAGLSKIFATGGESFDAAVGLDDVSWNTALVFSYPLFTGTAKFATKSRASEDVARLELERMVAGQRVEQRVRTSLHFMRGSWVKIDLTRAAATASSENFRLTQDAYRRGVGDILDVLDAQREALIANEAAASGVYDFLIDLIQVQRAIGRFEYLSSPGARDAFLSRLEFYFQSASQN